MKIKKVLYYDDLSSLEVVSWPCPRTWRFTPAASAAPASPGSTLTGSSPISSKGATFETRERATSSFRADFADRGGSSRPRISSRDKCYKTFSVFTLQMFCYAWNVCNLQSFVIYKCLQIFAIYKCILQIFAIYKCLLFANVCNSWIFAIYECL